MTGEKPAQLTFAAFTIDLAKGELTRAGQVLDLAPLPFGMLKLLAERAPEVVPNDEIITAVWSNPRSVTKDSVKQCAHAIRKALGSDYPDLIGNVAGVGYNLTVVATGVVAAENKIDHRQGVETARLPDKIADGADPRAKPAIRVTGLVTGRVTGRGIGRAIAALGLPARQWLRHRPGLAMCLATLLGFVGWFGLSAAKPMDPALISANLTMMAEPTITFQPTEAQAGAESPVLSMADDIATELRRTPRGYDLLILASPQAQDLTRARSLVAATSSLKARYLVTTRDRTVGAQRQLLVQLIETPSGRTVWAEPYAIAGTGLAQQNLHAAWIAREIAVQVRGHEARRPLPAIIEVGHLVLQGRVKLEGERGQAMNAEAKALFDEAVARDPNHIQALLGYARTRILIASNRWAPEAERAAVLLEAEGAVARILSIDKSSVGGHLVRGAIARARGQLDAAAAAYEHARLLNPNYPFAHAELGRTRLDQGNPTEALVHIGKAFELSRRDHISSNWYYWSGMASVHLGDDTAAIEHLQKSRALNANAPNPLPWLAVAYGRLGERGKAEAAMAEHLKLRPDFTVERWKKRFNGNAASNRARFDAFGAILISLGAPARN